MFNVIIFCGKANIILMKLLHHDETMRQTAHVQNIAQMGYKMQCHHASATPMAHYNYLVRHTPTMLIPVHHVHHMSTQTTKTNVRVSLL